MYLLPDHWEIRSRVSIPTDLSIMVKATIYSKPFFFFFFYHLLMVTGRFFSLISWHPVLQMVILKGILQMQADISIISFAYFLAFFIEHCTLFVRHHYRTCVDFLLIIFTHSQSKVQQFAECRCTLFIWQVLKSPFKKFVSPLPFPAPPVERTF